MLNGAFIRLERIVCFSLIGSRHPLHLAFVLGWRPNFELSAARRLAGALRQKIRTVTVISSRSPRLARWSHQTSLPDWPNSVAPHRILEQKAPETAGSAFQVRNLSDWEDLLPSRCDTDHICASKRSVNKHSGNERAPEAIALAAKREPHNSEPGADRIVRPALTSKHAAAEAPATAIPRPKSMSRGRR